MKKLSFLLILTVLSSYLTITSCSNDNVEQQAPETNSATFQEKSSWPCPPGYRLVWQLVETPIKAFKDPYPNCSKKFGFCFKVGAIWNIDCERIEPVAPPQLPIDLSFQKSTNSVKAGAIELDNGKIRFYFPEEVVESTDNVPSDFDYFAVDAIMLTNDIQLVPGSYPKIIDGSYFTYEVDYVIK